MINCHLMDAKLSDIVAMKNPSVLIFASFSPRDSHSLHEIRRSREKRNKSIEYKSLLFNFLLARRVQLLMSITKYIQTECLKE